MWIKISTITITLMALFGCSGTAVVSPDKLSMESTRETVSMATATTGATATEQPRPSETAVLVPSASATAPKPKYSPTAEIPKIKLTSPAFNSGGVIPTKYARDGDDISIPLIWGDPPSGTQSFVIVMESNPLMDGDVRWVHWVLYNIPAELRELLEGVEPDADGSLADGSQHVENSWQELRYGGPKTQRFETQKYTIMIYALDTRVNPVDLEEKEETESWFGSAKDRLLEVMVGHILAEGKLNGKYKPE